MNISALTKSMHALASSGLKQTIYAIPAFDQLQIP